MRKVAVFLLATAMVLPVPFSATPAGATGATVCKDLRGTESWKPALPKTASKRKTKPTISIRDAKLSGCNTGGVKSGAFSATIKYLDPGNCIVLHAYTPGDLAPKIKGTVTIVWNIGERSTVKVALSKTKPYVQVLKGTVSAGKFKGSKFEVLLLIDPQNDGCVKNDMAGADFFRLTRLVIR